MKRTLNCILLITALTLMPLTLRAQDTTSPVDSGASRVQQSDNADVHDIENVMGSFHEAARHTMEPGSLTCFSPMGTC
jgi:hypothetical protein